VNYYRLTDANGEVAYEENCGWNPSVARRLSPDVYGPGGGVRGMPADPKQWNSAGAFEGHNLVPNPQFTTADEKRKGKPAWWFAVGEFRKARKGTPLDHYDICGGDGEYAHDARVGCAAPGSLRVGRTGRDFALMTAWPVVHYGKRQGFSFYVKADGSGRTVTPEILFFSQDGHPELRNSPAMRLCGRAKGDAVEPTGEWQKVELIAQPPYGAHWACLLIRVDQNAAGHIWIDDAEFNGYGAEPLEITYSRLGYHPLSDKQFVIKGLEKAPVTWELQTADGTTARTGQAVYHSYEWFSKRHYWRVDLTDFQTPGRYRLVIRQGETKAATDLFAIDRDVYHKLTGMCLHSMYADRMNDYVPKVHLPYALEDCRTLVTVQKPRFELYETIFKDRAMEQIGGYDDASNEIKYTQFWPDVILACYQASRLARPLTDRGPNDGLDELAWAVMSFPKHQDDDGQFFRGVKPRAGRKNDHIVGWGWDRYCYGPSSVPQAAGALALGAYALKDSAPAEAQKALAAAVKNYDLNMALWDKYLPAPTAQPKLFIAAKALFAEMYLWKLTGDRRYAERMALHARQVAEGLKARAYAGAQEMYMTNFQHGAINQDCVIVPCLFVQMYPDHPAAEDVKAGLRAFADDIRNLSSREVWGQAMTIPIEGDPPQRWARTSRMIGYWPALAHGLAQIGMILHDEQIIRLAERQLQWTLGKNCIDVAVTHGVGPYAFAGGDGNHYRTEFMVDWLDNDRRELTHYGMTPTQGFRDIGDGKVVFGGGGWPPIHGPPAGYCRAWLQANFQQNPGPSETYLPQNADMTNAAAAVARALESLEN